MIKSTNLLKRSRDSQEEAAEVPPTKEQRRAAKKARKSAGVVEESEVTNAPGKGKEVARENGSATEQVPTPQELTKQQRKQIKKEEKKRLQAESDALAVSKERQAEHNSARRGASTTASTSKVPITNPTMDRISSPASDDDFEATIPTSKRPPIAPIKVSKASTSKAPPTTGSSEPTRATTSSRTATREDDGDSSFDEAEIPKAYKAVVDKSSLGQDAPSKKGKAPKASKEVVAKTPKVAKEKKEKKGKAVEKPKKAVPAVDWAHMNAKDIISSQWLPLKQLKELADEHGFTYLTGKFTKAEDNIIHETIDNYARVHNLSESEITTLITASRFEPAVRDLMDTHKGFFTIITRALDLRPHTSVHAHVKRMFDPRARGGPWTKQEDAALVAAVKQHGNLWSTIGESVGRTGTDCRDHWREQGRKITVLPRGKKAESVSQRDGPWNREEKRLLVELVTKYGRSWETVALSLKTRSAHQCRIKWGSGMLIGKKMIKANSPRFKAHLIKAVADMGVDDTERITWLNVQDPILQGHDLARRWKSLTKPLREQDITEHADQVAELLQLHPISETYGPARRVFRKQRDHSLEREIAAVGGQENGTESAVGSGGSSDEEEDDQLDDDEEEEEEEDSE